MRSELAALQQYWHCFPFQYFRHDLYRADCDLSLDAMKNYVPLFFFNHLFFPSLSANYGVACEDKLLTNAALKAYAIAQPKFLFGYENEAFYDGNNNPLTPQEIDALLERAAAPALFIKPRFGSEGKGITVFNRGEAGFQDKTGAVFTAQLFQNRIATHPVKGRDKSGFFIAQEGLVQHHDLASIYPHAINTFRLFTAYEQGQARILYALLRMGRGGNQVDNAASGGIYTSVDPHTGMLGDIALSHNHTRFNKHPDTGFVFQNHRIKQWPQLAQFTTAAAQKFRDLTYIGWDVALTRDGPAVIELNIKPDMDMIQDFYGGVREALHIEPKLWWRQPQFTLKNR